MNEKTDLKFAKDMAKCLLYTRPMEVEEFPFFLIHPFITSRMFPINNKYIDVMESEDNIRKVRDIYLERITKAKDIHEILFFMHKPYKTLYFKLVADALSKEDYNDLLASIWVGTENVNQDINVKISEWVKFFKKADKFIMMNEDEIAVYNKFSEYERIRVYRGVGVDRNPNGMSWTVNYDKAEWFARRWGDGDIYIIQGICFKSDILAYFNTREEEELVLDPKSVINKERIILK